MLKVLGVFCAASVLVFAADDTDAVARGKYLVNEVAKCQECHTPRNDKGELDETQWLKGATLDFQPTHEVKGWHKTAPDLTSTGRLYQRWGEDGLVKFMETGANPRGGKADPPMPAYKLRPDDAKAIVEYLKTLK